MPPAPPAPAATSPTAKVNPRFWALIGLAGILIFVTGVRLRLAPTPLERDEGEYAFVGQLMLQGIPPYTEAANMKFPGTYAVYALIEAVFGQTATGIHHGLLVFNLATILLIYHLGCKFFARRHPAVMAAAIYAVCTLSYSFLGPMAHATHFVVFFGLAGLALLLTSFARNSLAGLALAGFVTGLAYLAKQSGFYFVPLGGLLILAHHHWRPFSAPALRSMSFFILGAFAPFAVTVFLLNQAGALDQFIFWTFLYATTYGPSLGEAPSIFLYHLKIMGGQTYAWIFFAPCLLAFLPPCGRSGDLPLPSRLPLHLLFLLSLAGVSSGLYFRSHYWIQALPAIALLSALFFQNLAALLGRRMAARYPPIFAALLCLGFCGAVLTGEAKLLFQLKPTAIISEIYGGQPFVEAQEVSRFLKEHSLPTDRIFVFGCEPEIYFYAQRPAASNNLYVCYNLLTPHRFSSTMLAALSTELTQAPPRYFIEANVRYFTTAASRQSDLYQWRTAFLARHYHPLFMIDMYLEGNETIPARALTSYTSASGCYLTVWERNP